MFSIEARLVWHPYCRQLDCFYWYWHVNKCFIAPLWSVGVWEDDFYWVQLRPDWPAVAKCPQPGGPACNVSANPLRLRCTKRSRRAAKPSQQLLYADSFPRKKEGKTVFSGVTAFNASAWDQSETFCHLISVDRCLNICRVCALVWFVSLVPFCESSPVLLHVSFRSSVQSVPFSFSSFFFPTKTIIVCTKEKQRWEFENVTAFFETTRMLQSCSPTFF